MLIEEDSIVHIFPRIGASNCRSTSALGSSGGPKFNVISGSKLIINLNNVGVFPLPTFTCQPLTGGQPVVRLRDGELILTGSASIATLGATGTTPLIDADFYGNRVRANQLVGSLTNAAGTSVIQCGINITQPSPWNAGSMNSLVDPVTYTSCSR
jgi:hypothetical protein